MVPFPHPQTHEVSLEVQGIQGGEIRPLHIKVHTTTTAALVLVRGGSWGWVLGVRPPPPHP